MKRISVVIASYNHAAYILETLESVLAQTAPAAEVIVVDDGSTDGGADCVLDLGLPSVRLLRQTNAGVSAARNAGVQAARGDWVAFLDADDRFAPGHLAVLRRLADQFPEAGMLATGYCRLSADGRREPVALGFGPGLLDDFYGRWSRLTFTFTSAICIRAVVMRSQSISFPLGERLGEDQDVWFRMAEAAPVAYAGTTLVDYRLDVSGSATAAAPRPADLLPCYRRLRQRLDSGATPPALRRGARRLLGSHWLNVARARHAVGERDAAWALWRESPARGNPVYWLRTGLQWLAAAARHTG